MKCWLGGHDMDLLNIYNNIDYYRKHLAANLDVSM